MRTSLASRESLLTIFVEHPVLARLIAIVIDGWIHGSSEFLEDLSEDFPGLQQRFGRLGRVSRIKAQLSDAHNRRKFVNKLEFGSLRTFYGVYQMGDV